MTLYDVVFIFEVLALMSAAYFHFKQRTSRSIVILLLLVTIVLFETITKFELIPGMNLLVINLIVLFELIFYFLLFALLMQAGNRRRYVVTIALVYIAYWIYNACCVQPLLDSMQTYSYIFGASGILVTIFLYFYQDLIVVNRSEPLHTRYFLWVSSGLFIFLAVDIPIMGIVNYMIENQVSMREMPVFKVKSAVTILYYSCYPIGLIWMRTE